MSKPIKAVVYLGVLLLLGVAFYVLKVSWFERYVWRGPVEGMQPLPPLEVAELPVPPVGWRVEAQSIEVATPEGLGLVDIQYHINSMDMDFVYIEPGSFRPTPGFRNLEERWGYRRASRWQSREMPPLVTISRPYFIGAFEVTNREFELFDPSHRGRRPDYQQDDQDPHFGDFHPVEPVTWREAQQFARWLSIKEGRIYRLPTEAEWEYAARAGTEGRLYWGEAFWDRSKANLGGLHSTLETRNEDGFKFTAPVGSFPANPWGVYDVVGNSYEWVQDWWHPNLTADAVDPSGPAEGKIRMGKGGGWTTRPYATFTGEDDGNNPADLRDSRGFRLLVEFPSAPK